MQQGKKVDTQEVIKILENSPQKGRDMAVIGKKISRLKLWNIFIKMIKK